LEMKLWDHREEIIDAFVKRFGFFWVSQILPTNCLTQPNGVFRCHFVYKLIFYLIKWLLIIK
jgi:hypothetical protein